MDKTKKYLLNAGFILTIFLTVLVLALSLNQFEKRKHIGLTGPRSIDVRAEEVLHRTPDEAEITFSVVTENEDYKTATQENSSQMEEVSDYLKERGIKEENMRTLNFSVSPRYENIERRGVTGREIVGYRVENNLKIKIENLEEIDSIIAGAIESGANRVSGLSFLVSNEDEVKSLARDKAIANAREEAKSIARSLGVRVGRVLDYSESGDIYFPRVSMDAMREAPEADYAVPIEPGENEIRSTVTVTFEIF